MTTSLSGVHLLQQFESCQLKAYLDPRGIPTIGWGHTGPEVHDGLVCTQDQANEWLVEDLRVAESVVNAWVQVPLTQHEFDALVSFVYNVGPGKVGEKDGFVWLKARDAAGQPRHSTLLTAINAGDFEKAAAQFPLWARSGGVELRGLLKRRLAEQALFRS